MLTIQTNTSLHTDESLDMNLFLKQRVGPLLHKFKSRLVLFEQTVNSDSKKFQQYSLYKIQTTYNTLERLEQEWHTKSLHTKEFISMDTITQALDQALMDLSECYRELETSMIVSNETIDDTIDEMMLRLEEFDGHVADAFLRASQVRDRVNEKLHEMADLASDHMDQIKGAMANGAKRLLHYEELPIPWRNNENIYTGYRFLNSTAECWYSLLYVHNETGNIYTHLFGLVFLAMMGTYHLLYSPVLSDIPIVDKVFFGIFFIAACKCLLCSTVWHTLSGISDLQTYRKVACLDYVGISVLICASIILCEYYGFYNHDIWRNTYITATGSMAVLGVAMPFMSWFDHSERRWLRTTFFVVMASSAVIPIVHLCIANGPKETANFLSPFSKSITSYIIGVIVYGNQLPERIWPGKFDHLGHSHQLWHLFVMGGIWYNYTAIFHMVNLRETYGQIY
ncbi:hemolysin-III related-domain-containing protein [Phycomyces nitens]|nr:hemolysin-III related-domain-containing protein [Phycomyces nitens]